MNVEAARVLMVLATTRLMPIGVIVQNFLQELIVRRVKHVYLLFSTEKNPEKYENCLQQLSIPIDVTFFQIFKVVFGAYVCNGLNASVESEHGFCIAAAQLLIP